MTSADGTPRALWSVDVGTVVFLGNGLTALFDLDKNGAPVLRINERGVERGRWVFPRPDADQSDGGESPRRRSR